MANTLTFDQISTVLNDIVKQATGMETMKATDTSSFVAQAQTALLGMTGSWILSLRFLIARFFQCVLIPQNLGG